MISHVGPVPNMQRNFMCNNGDCGGDEIPRPRDSNQCRVETASITQQIVIIQQYEYRWGIWGGEMYNGTWVNDDGG